MTRRALTILMALVANVAFGQEDTVPADRQTWSETRTAHFHIYSSGEAQQVRSVAARLEQFREAYSLLAGREAVASPPIIVLAFPDHKTMSPFLPVYNGQPANLAGFFNPTPDENLIVMSLSGANSTMAVIYHEYTHVLLRRNDNVWPPWLSEGMAEMYSTFEAMGRGVRIGLPIEHHLRLLRQNPMMPLHRLLAVTHESPDYNESDRQGVFYAESWLLTHYLMNGDNVVLKSRFGQYTKLLNSGQSPEEALTNALMVSLPALEGGLHRYLERGQFESIDRVVSEDLSMPQKFISRPVGRVEACFRLGDELMRIGRLDDAQGYFLQAKKLAPASPLPYEGLGLLAAERGRRQEAVEDLKQSLDNGAVSYLAHYVYAREKLNLQADPHERFKRLNNDLANEIRNELEKSIAMMPDFGPAHESLGFLELVQEDNLGAAEEHFQRAIQLEPENQSYLLSLALAQGAKSDYTAAHHTLEPLLLPHVDANLRDRAQAILSEIDRESLRAHP